jgi:hypothetical protein
MMTKKVATLPINNFIFIKRKTQRKGGKGRGKTEKHPH